MTVLRVDEVEDLPSSPGAYGLVIELLRPIAPLVGRLGAVEFDVGRYFYAGSARGPGGIRARVRRHVRPGKTPRWHVDRLTNPAGVQAVLALTGGDECALAAAVLERFGATVPVPGFGSSDCRTCPSHLLALPEGCVPEAMLERLALERLGGDGGVLWLSPPVLCWWTPPPAAGSKARPGRS